MIEPQRVASLIQAALIADSYCLGLHWIYDHELLDRVPLAPDRLHPPMSHWHGAKTAGDLTHYGDQLWHLYQFLQQPNAPCLERYPEAWAAFMESYHGYIDKATGTALDNIRHGKTPSGSMSAELSASSRIACPLLCSASPEDYLEQVGRLTRMTHDCAIVVDSCRFFAKVLLACHDGVPIAEAVAGNLEILPATLQAAASQGIDSASEDTRTVLRQFGIAGEMRYGFPGVMHLIHRYRDPMQMLQENALSGGDSSARGMIAVMLMIAERPERMNSLPQQWLQTIISRKGRN